MKSSTGQKILFFILLPLFLFGCENNININDSHNDNTIHGSGKIISQTRTVNDCSDIKVINVGDVYLVQDNHQSIRVEADDNIMRRVIVEERNGVLNVGLEEGSYSNITCKIYVSLKTIENLTIEGAGSINVENSIACNDLGCFIIGAGNINIKGHCNFLDCMINGAGNINAHEFTALKCRAVVNGAGKCTVNSSEELTAILTGVGSIIYYGNPKNVHTSISGVGQIVRK